MRCALAFALTVLGLVPVLAGEFPFTESEIDSRFSSAQELAGMDIGFQRQECRSEGGSHACTYTTTNGARIVFGYVGSSPISTIVVIFDEPSAREAYTIFVVSALAFHLGIEDWDVALDEILVAADDFTAQAAASSYAIDVSVRDFSWKYFSNLGQKDTMFIEAE